MFDAFPRPMLFAHRGASSYAPENTLAAFELAVRQFKHQPPAVELDAKLSKDGKVFVFHDQTLERTTNGAGRVSDLTLEQLREFDAGAYFDLKFAGEKIPTLDEVFESIGGKALINVELTNYATLRDALNEHVADIVQHHNMSGRVIFSSFSSGNLRKMARLLPEVPRALLIYSGAIGSLQRTWAGILSTSYQALNPHFRSTTSQLVDLAHRKGQRVNVYTVNETGELLRLAKLGVDGIFTDDVLTAEEALSRYSTGA